MDEYEFRKWRQQQQKERERKQNRDMLISAGMIASPLLFLVLIILIGGFE